MRVGNRRRTRVPQMNLTELLSRCFAAAVKEVELDKEHRHYGHHPSPTECEV